MAQPLGQQQALRALRAQTLRQQVQPLWRVLPLAQQEQALQRLQLEQLLLEQV
jgi:hypothetical protein